MSKKLFDVFNLKKMDVQDFKPALSKLSCPSTLIGIEKQSNENLNIANNLLCNKIYKHN